MDIPEEPLVKKIRETPLPKYSFVSYDDWMTSSFPIDRWVPILMLDPTMDHVDAPRQIFQSIRPIPVWFSMSEGGISSECINGQNSTVCHCPFVEVAAACGTQKIIPVYFAEKEKTELSHRINPAMADSSVVVPVPSYFTFTNPLFQSLVIADIVSNVGRRDPLKYASTWPIAYFGKAVATGNANLAVARTLDNAETLYNHPGIWEHRNRLNILREICFALHAVSDLGDLVVPLKGLVCSVWLGGLLFRLAQLFFKITIGRSIVFQSVPCDVFFVFCQGKRPLNKHVLRTLKLFEKLVNDVDTKLMLLNNPDSSSIPWGYSVPPVCFTDPAFVNWVQQVNAQLMTGFPQLDTVESSHAFYSIPRIATALRIKKYIFWNENNSPDTPSIGVYFGSFNPVHENHIALVKFARERYNMKHIYLVPNRDNNANKIDLVSLPHRLDMLTRRIESDADLAQFVSVVAPPSDTTRWESKSVFAEGLAEEYFQDSPLIGQPVLLLGQDSWNQAVLKSSRDKVTRHFIGIAKLARCKIIIFPRSTENDSTPVLPAPKPIRELVTVADEYADPIESLSSSAVRCALVTDPELVRQKNWLTAPVLEYISERGLYKCVPSPVVEPSNE